MELTDDYFKIEFQGQKCEKCEEIMYVFYVFVYEDGKEKQVCKKCIFEYTDIDIEREFFKGEE